jgi:hypothetical protein
VGKKKLEFSSGPLGFEDENAKVIVKNGRHTLEKTTLKNIQQQEHFKPWAANIKR